jgi:ribosomal protein S27AE
VKQPKVGDTCPKCGLGKIDQGPYFEAGYSLDHDDDALKYWCGKCHFTIKVPCADAAKPKKGKKS